MEIIFPTKIGSKCCRRPSYPITLVLLGGKAGSQFPGFGVCVCPFIGLPASHRATYSVSGREAQLLQALRFYPVPPLRNVDYCVFLASGVVGLWSREGCGAGPNLHSVVTSTGASATAGIPNRIPPCPALHLYPGLQVPVSSMTYR